MKYNDLPPKDKLIYHQYLRDERSHMEGLLNQRFSFLIIVFGFIVASFPYVKNSTQLGIVLVFGWIFIVSFTFLIGRAQRRFEINLDLQYNLPNDPTKEIKDLADSGKKTNPFTRRAKEIVGYYIPIALSIIIGIAMFFPGPIFNFITNSEVTAKQNQKCQICSCSRKDTIYIQRVNVHKSPISVNQNKTPN